MSCLNLGKKLLPARKAWKSFTSTLQKKIRKVKRSKIIKKTTNRLKTSLGTVLNRSRSRRKRKRWALTRPASALRRPRRFNHQLPHSFAPVYIDELFMEKPVAVQIKLPEQPVIDKVIDKGTSSAAISQSSAAATTVSQLTAWKTKRFNQPKATNSVSGTFLSAVPQLRGVDERAEEFIANFREEMRRQKQKSIGEFQEMLARGV